MNRLTPLLFALLLFTEGLLGQEPPDWATRDYSVSADKVFAAALQSIQEQRHEVKSKDDGTRTVEFHVGTTAWSWGYNMILTVTPIEEGHARVIVRIARSGGKAVSWGSGKKEVIKILAGIDADLAVAKTSSP
jgi:hypothetical protein